MSAHDVATRVRQLLETSGLAQKDLADLLNVDPDRVSKSMNGIRRFTSLELAKISERFGVTVNWLLGVEEAVPAIAARYNGTHARIDPAKERLNDLAEVRTSLVELGYPNEIPVLEYGDETTWIRQGEIMADKALDLIEKADAELSPGHFLETIERVFEVDVALLPLADGCDGLAWRQGNGAIIAATTTGVTARQRFTLAHELCHALHQDNQELHVDQNVYRTAKNDPSEVRANSFAACFVLAERHLRFDSRTDTLSDHDFASMVMDYVVSPSTLAYRLLNLGVIDDDEKDRFGRRTIAGCAAETERSSELAQWVAESSSPRLPYKLLKDSLHAYFDGTTTLRLFARVAQVPVEDVRIAIESASATHEDDE